MAQIIHDIDVPNSGLGDQLRTAFDNQNTMNAELYGSKVDKVMGKGLSENDYTDADKALVDGINPDAEENVQSDWNELDPASDSFILGKPIFESSEIRVSALWTSGLSFDVSADAFPINNVMYPANPAEVTLDAADGALDRIDLIVAIKPVDPLTVGEVGKITGTPASEALVVPPDFDPSIFYVIKQVIVRAAATEPEGVSTTQIYDEGVEWGVTLTGNIVQTANDPSSGAVSLEGTNVTSADFVTLDPPDPLSTTEIGSITFDLKLKEAVIGKSIFLTFSLNGSHIKKYIFNNNQNGFNDADLGYQTITIDGDSLGLPIMLFDSIVIHPFFTSAGYFIDNIVLHTGSGSDPAPSEAIPDAPNDGRLWGRRNQAWDIAASFSDNVAGNILVSDGNEFKPVQMSGDATIASDGTVTVDGSQLTDVDAESLDGFDSSQFLRSDVADTKTSGNLTFSSAVRVDFNGQIKIFGGTTDAFIDLFGGSLFIRDNTANRFTFSRTTGNFIATGTVKAANLEITGNAGFGTGSPNQKVTIEGTMDLKEQASANSDNAGYGQIWVKSGTPNELFFTDDTGIDFKLGGKTVTNSASTPYVLSLSDIGQIVVKTAIGNVEIPNNATVPFPIGTEIIIIHTATGSTLIDDSEITLNFHSNHIPNKSVYQYERRLLTKIDTDTWILSL